MWLSAFFILVANSWMQRPVGYELVNGRAELTSIGDLLGSRFAWHAWLHTTLVGLTTGSMLVLGIACWHFLRGRNVEIFRKAALLALIVAVPVSAANLAIGSRFGIVTTDDQPMKIAASEALWDTEQPASFSVFQIGGFTKDDQTPSFDIEIPGLLSFLATGSFNSAVEGLNEIQSQYEKQYGRGNYIPPVRASYWAMRVMAYLGTLIFLVAALGALLYRKRRLENARWFNWIAVVTIAFPFIAALSGWVLTEVGRQPWIVQGLLRTDDANSPTVSTWTVGLSLGVFVGLYLTLGVLDFVLMRRYARLDPSSPGPEELPQPVPGY